MANSPKQCSPNDWNLATNMNHQINNRTKWLNIDNNEPVLYGIKTRSFKWYVRCLVPYH